MPSQPEGPTTGAIEIRSQGQMVAILVRGSNRAPGVRFVTPDAYSQQLGFIRHPAGTLISAHVHNVVSSDVCRTLEVLFVKAGRLRVDLYDDGRRYLESRVLSGGDTILFVSGGHGFEVFEEVEMIEVRQGPFSVDAKTCFPAVTLDRLRVSP